MLALQRRAGMFVIHTGAAMLILKNQRVFEGPVTINNVAIAADISKVIFYLYLKKKLCFVSKEGAKVNKTAPSIPATLN